MYDALTSPIQAHDFHFWPFKSGKLDFILLLVLIAAIVFVIRLMVKDYRQQATDFSSSKEKARHITLDWSLLVSAAVCLIGFAAVNIHQITTSMKTAQILSNVLTLNGEKLVVVPDFPQKQKFLVLDNYKTIATITATGYHTRTAKGKALYKIADKVYNYRYLLTVSQDKEMFGKNNRINRVGNTYQVFSWSAGGVEQRLTANCKTGRLTARHDSEENLKLQQQQKRPLPFDNSNQSKQDQRDSNGTHISRVK